MLLAIDIGNTNVVIGCIRNESVMLSGRIISVHTFSCEEYSAEMKGILDAGSINMNDIEGSIISSVVPQLTNTLERAVRVLTNTTPVMVGPRLKTDLNLLIENPDQLGSDRIVDAAAAANYYGRPVIIIDMGTATTISVVDENSNFLGGMIMPGVKSSLEALANRAAQLPHVKVNEAGNLIGRNTVECIQSGSIYGNAAMIDGIVRRLRKQIGQHATVVATGGLSQLIVPHCEEEIIYDEHLLLKGLYLLYIKNNQ